MSRDARRVFSGRASVVSKVTASSTKGYSWGGVVSGEVEGVPRAVPQVDGEELAEEEGCLP